VKYQIFIHDVAISANTFCLRGRLLLQYVT